MVCLVVEDEDLIQEMLVLALKRLCDHQPLLGERLWRYSRVLNQLWEDFL